MRGSARGTSVVRGGRLLDAPMHRADAADILIKGDAIVEVGRPGMKVPAGAEEIDARDRLLHPGLVNAHTHCPGLAKTPFHVHRYGATTY